MVVYTSIGFLIYYLETYMKLPIKQSDYCIQCQRCSGTCSDCRRKDFIDNCLPLLDVVNANTNILNWDRTSYVWHVSQPNPTYAQLSKDFHLHLVGESSDLPEYRNPLNGFNTFITDNLNKHIFVGECPIPIYYLRMNDNNYFFDIFINFCLYKDKQQILEPFVFNRETGKFITLSFKFNIFNVALLCGKFFEVMSLFLIDQDDIMRELVDIFGEFSLVNLYNLINLYKVPLMSIQRNQDELRSKGYDPVLITTTSIKNYPTSTEKANYRKINNLRNLVNTEMGNTKITIQYIYQNFYDYVIECRLCLKELNLLIPDFDKIFLMSILSRRLSSTTINNTWPFDITSVVNNLIESIRDSPIPIPLQELKLLYGIDKPILYEYTLVKYEGSEYPNCMENTLLQFLKVLFYDKDLDRYNTEVIRKVCRDEVASKLIGFFEVMDSSERTGAFISSWVEFLMTINQSVPRTELYDFLDKTANVELNPILENLIRFVGYLVPREEGLSLDIKILERFVEDVNETYNLEIKRSPKQDIIKITTYKTYTLVLDHNIHAKFEEARDSDIAVNILKNIEPTESISDYLRRMQYLTYSDINSYMCLDFIESKDPFYEHYLKTLDNEKIQNGLTMFFAKISDIKFESAAMILEKTSSSVWDFNLWKKLFRANRFLVKAINEGCFLNWSTQLFRGSTVWHYAVLFIKPQEFWEEVINRNLCADWNINNEGDTVWHSAVIHIKSEEFWNKVLEKGFCRNWNAQDSDGDTVWHIAIKFIRSEYFWNKVLESRLCERWGLQNNKGDTVWHVAIREDKKKSNIPSRTFWNNSLDTDQCGEWIIENVEGKTTWEYLLSNPIFIESTPLDDDITTTDSVRTCTFPCSFWMRVIDMNLCVNWNFKVWDKAITKIEFEQFWIKVVEKDLCQNWDSLSDLIPGQLWGTAIENIKFEEFWNKVAEKELCKNWDSYRDWLTLTPLWNLAREKITSLRFWEINKQNGSYDENRKNVKMKRRVKSGGSKLKISYIY